MHGCRSPRVVAAILRGSDLPRRAELPKPEFRIPFDNSVETGMGTFGKPGLPAEPIPGGRGCLSPGGADKRGCRARFGPGGHSASAQDHSILILPHSDGVWHF